MLDNLKQAGKNIGRELGRTWENLSEDIDNKANDMHEAVVSEFAKLN